MFICYDRFNVLILKVLWQEVNLLSQGVVTGICICAESLKLLLLGVPMEPELPVALGSVRGLLQAGFMESWTGKGL